MDPLKKYDRIGGFVAAGTPPDSTILPAREQDFISGKHRLGRISLFEWVQTGRIW